jgi:hypothetical protein
MSSDNKNEISIASIDELLATQRKQNDNQQWNKVERSLKLKKLYYYAETHGLKHSMDPKDIKALKMFFTSSLNKGRLLKNKEVIYNSEKCVIESIPGLQYNTNTKNFTIRNTETKHVSTVKSKQKKTVNKIKVDDEL